MRRSSDGRPIPILGFSRRYKIPRCSVHDIGESIWFRNPDYDPDRAQKLISSSVSRHLSTRKISSKSMHAFLSNLANRQTDRQTISQAIAFTTSFVGGKYNILSCCLFRSPDQIVLFIVLPYTQSEDNMVP